MKILVDTREKAELNFDLEVERRKLDVGDYGCIFDNEFIPPVFFERKSLADLFGTLGKGYKRFRKEIDRAKEQNIKLIIIVEGNYSKILKGYKYSKTPGLTIIRILLTLWVKYGVSHLFFKNREEMSSYIEEYYYSLYKERLKKLKGGEK